MHVPDPLHTSLADEVVPFTHVGATHTVPAECSAQLRLPEQLPFVPQVEAGCAAHSLSGSVPSGIARHCPSAEGELHVSQAPAHAESQHTPSTQWPDAHCAGLPHVVPLGLGRQIPFGQCPL